MSQPLVMLSLQTSLKAYLNSLKLQLETLGVTVDVFDLDAHAIDSKTPNMSLLTISGFSMVEDEGNIIVDVAFGATTVTDPDLGKLNYLAAVLFDATRNGVSFPAIHHTTGEKIGVIKITNGTRITPVSGEDSRPIRAVLVTMVTTVT